jgi:hypothetical protein
MKVVSTFILHLSNTHKNVVIDIIKGIEKFKTLLHFQLPFVVHFHWFIHERRDESCIEKIHVDDDVRFNRSVSGKRKSIRIDD